MLTQIYWKSHVQIFQWYKSKISKIKPKNFLEIGSGHGLLSKELLIKKNISGTICDISQQSLNFTKIVEEIKTFSLYLTYHPTIYPQMTLRLHLRVTEWLT